MTQATIDPIAAAVFLLTAFVLAGIVQTLWFLSPRSRALAIPIDGGATWRGRRVFGEHKMLRGFVMMAPAAAAAFAVLSIAAGDPAAAGLWIGSPLQYAALGAWAGVGFMAGELPNSFVKRQLDIDPGGAPRSTVWAAVQFVADRLDSGVGMLIFLSLAVPVPAATWAIVLLAGPPLHWAFSVLMFRLRLKARPA